MKKKKNTIPNSNQQTKSNKFILCMSQSAFMFLAKFQEQS